jgi:hypothetical protein
MVMRYAHLSPGYLSDEVKKLDTFTLSARGTERAKKKADVLQKGNRSRATVVKCPRKDGSSGWRSDLGSRDVKSFDGRR